MEVITYLKNNHSTCTMGFLCSVSLFKTGTLFFFSLYNSLE